MDEKSGVYKCDHTHEDHVCHHNLTNPSVHQTLDELDFDRGIWNSALAGDLHDVKRKLEQTNDACASKPDKSGYTPLHYASRSGHTEICELLLQYGAPVNAATLSGGATPLHRAAYMGHTHILSMLLDHGADPLMVDADGMTPLHKAADRSHLTSIQLLVKSGPDAVAVRDNRGRRPEDLFKSSDLQSWWKHDKFKYTQDL